MEHTEVAGFAADAIGIPGSRTFLIQFSGSFGRHTYLLEKGQVAALAAGVDELLGKLGAIPDSDLVAPVLIDELPRFRIGQLALGYDQSEELAVLSLQSVSEEDEEVAYYISLDQLAAGARQGETAVGGGRPSCPHCGLAMDPEGHACPTTNGDLRNHQP